MIDTRTLGDYTLIKQVGQGSMGAVFLAEHRFIKKQYILKVLPEELASDRAFIQRFEEDVAMLAALEHPHIVKIHTVSFDQGQYFLVTDCVVDEFGETTNLGQYMLSRGKRFDEETLFRLLKQLAEALDYAHNKKNSSFPVIHRNLKLNNILVAKGRGGIDLMISDFGLSRIIGTSAVLTRNYKAMAEFLGVFSSIYGFKNGQDRYGVPPIDPQKLSSLHSSFLQNFIFLAPEQKYLGMPHDSKVDVYAFGILVYYLLVGEFPDGLFEMPSKLVPEMIWNWDSLILACLSQNPKKRPENLVAALDAVRQQSKNYIVKEAVTFKEELSPKEIGSRKEFIQEAIQELFQENEEKLFDPINIKADEFPLKEEKKTVARIPLPDILHLLEKAMEGDSAVEEKVSIDCHQEDVQLSNSVSSPFKEMAVNAAFSPSLSLQMELPFSPSSAEYNVSAKMIDKEEEKFGRIENLHKIEVVSQQAVIQHLRPIIRTAEIERPSTDLDPALALLVDATVKHYIPERKEVKNTQPILTEMIVVSGGSFYRGSMDGNRDEMPKHCISLSSFAIDVHPVTNEQFVRFLEVMGGEKDSNHQDIIRMRDSRIKRSGGKLSIESGYSKHPVVGVTWYGAIAYAKWVGKRLPTEAEWEVAARGGFENMLYPTGDDIEKTQANFFSSDTIAVMSYAPNGYGLYDMVGNVYEWCYDWYGYNYYEISVQEPDNPTGPLQGVYRVLRGGCWKSLKEDLRCSRRHRNNPGTVNGTYGFRCATDVQ